MSVERITQWMLEHLVALSIAAIVLGFVIPERWTWVLYLPIFGVMFYMVVDVQRSARRRRK